MRRLNKEEMLDALAEVALSQEFDDYEDYSKEDMVTELDGEVTSWFVEEISGSTENFRITSEERGGEGDGADMFIVFKIVSLKEEAEGYLEFSGRYSSWDSSEYYECYPVEPRQVTVTEYFAI